LMQVLNVLPAVVLAPALLNLPQFSWRLFPWFISSGKSSHMTLRLYRPDTVFIFKVILCISFILAQFVRSCLYMHCLALARAFFLRYYCASMSIVFPRLLLFTIISCVVGRIVFPALLS
jgi:hypothetical protein